MSNFPCSLTRNITPRSMKNLGFHSLLCWYMVLVPILTTSLIRLFLKSWENVLFDYSWVKGLRLALKFLLPLHVNFSLLVYTKLCLWLFQQCEIILEERSRGRRRNWKRDVTGSVMRHSMFVILVMDFNFATNRENKLTFQHSRFSVGISILPEFSFVMCYIFHFHCQLQRLRTNRKPWGHSRWVFFYPSRPHVRLISHQHIRRVAVRLNFPVQPGSIKKFGIIHCPPYKTRCTIPVNFIKTFVSGISYSIEWSEKIDAQNYLMCANLRRLPTPHNSRGRKWTA